MKTRFFFLISFLLLTIQACRDEKKGCTNELAKNFKQIAEVDCCCKYDDAIAIEIITGTFRLRSQCNNGSSTYDIEISKISNSEDSINIYNLFNLQSNLGAHFIDGAFTGQRLLTKAACVRKQTISLGLQNRDLHVTFDQKKSSGDCGFEIDIYCEGIGERL